MNRESGSARIGRTIVFAVVAVAASLGCRAGEGVSKARYLDLVEAAVNAYSPEHIRDYHARVQKDGIREHGFARLTANLGVLVAQGRRPADKDLFREMMDTCCERMSTALRDARRTPKSGGTAVGNDFSVKEIVLCLLAVEKAKVFPKEVTERWRAGIRKAVAEEIYNVQPKPGDSTARNWCVFGAASEQTRVFAGLAGSTAYVERYISDQLRFFDVNGMYKDPHQPMVYDVVTRLQFMVALTYGYDGPSRAALEANLLKSAGPTLLMQGATGELPYGGRSNQFLHCETHYAAVCEWYAAWFRKRGDLQTAARFRLAAKRAVDSLDYWLKQPSYRHIKNRFPLESRQGCEGYGYFDKYMVTMGSWAWLACLFADEYIPAADAEPKASVYETSRDFHRAFLRAGEYGVQLDTDCDRPYDANGIGRVQRRGAPPMLALSVPFPDGVGSKPNYVTGVTNETSLAILPGWKQEDGAWSYAYRTPYVIREMKADGASAQARVEVPREGRAPLRWDLGLSPGGLEMTVTGEADEEVALTLPAFAFDGETQTKIRADETSLNVTFRGWTARMTTTGEMIDTQKIYGNRNGFSRRYEARGRSPLRVRIVLESEGMK